MRHQTLSVVNRDFGLVDYTVSCEKGRVLISTDLATLSVLPDGKPFSRENFAAQFELNGKTKNFVFGMSDAGVARVAALTGSIREFLR